MVALYNAYCRQCHFSRNFSVERDRLRNGEHDLRPGLCEQCHEFIVVTIPSPEPACPNCQSPAIVMYGHETVLKESVEASRDEIMEEFRLSESAYLARRPDRVADHRSYLQTEQINARVSIELLALLKGSPIEQMLSAAGITNPSVWSPILPRVTTRMDSELREALLQGWERGFILQDTLGMYIDSDSNDDYEIDWWFRLDDLGISLLYGKIAGETDRIYENTGTVDQLQVDLEKCRLAMMSDDDLDIVAENEPDLTFLQLNRVESVEKWVEIIMNRKPEWHEGRHRCPYCNTDGIQFKLVARA